MLDRLVVGIDVGSSKLCSAVAASDPDGTIRYIGHGSTPSEGLRAGHVVDAEAMATAFEYALDEVRRLAGQHISDVFVSVSGARLTPLERSGSLDQRGPVTFSREDVMRALPNAHNEDPEGMQTVHRIVQSIAIDGQEVEDPAGRQGRTLAVKTRDFAMERALVDRLSRAAARAGGRIHALVPQGVAAGAAALTDDERELGALLIDIGSATTDIAVYCAGDLYDLISFPLGGHHITADLAMVLDIPIDEAERLKCLHGAANVLDQRVEQVEFSARTLAIYQRMAREGRAEPEVVRAIAGARLVQIFHNIGTLVREWDVRESLMAGAVLTGGTARLGGADAIARSALGLPVRSGGVIATEGFPAIPDPCASASIGLVRYCAGKADRPIPRGPLATRPGFAGMVAGGSGEDSPNWSTAHRHHARIGHREATTSRGWGHALRHWMREFIPSRTDD